MDAFSSKQCLCMVSEQRPILPCLCADPQGKSIPPSASTWDFGSGMGTPTVGNSIALPKWINNYHCLGLFAQVCGPMLTPSCAMWCDDTRLCEELIECHIGSFVQVHIESLFSDLVRIDLQAALQRAFHTLHLPRTSLPDDLVKMKIFVPMGVTCFSGATFECTSPFENWQAVLMAEGRRVYPGRNPDTMIFHRVHKAIEEVCSVFDPAIKHFILADSEEQERTRTVVFAIFTSRFEFFGACH